MNITLASRTLVAISITAAINVSAHADSTPIPSLERIHAPTPVTLISVTDPACNGGLGFKRLDQDDVPDRRTFVVPDDAVFVAANIRWSGRAAAFHSSTGRVAFEISAVLDDSASERPGPRAVVNDTRVGIGRASGERNDKAGISFEGGTALCGHLRAGNALADSRAGSAWAMIRGYIAGPDPGLPR